MNRQEMSATIRTETGKGAARKMRSDGFMPAVAYGKTIEPLPLTLEVKDVEELISGGKPLRTLIQLNIEGENPLGDKQFLFKEIQRHHIKRTPMTADLVEVDLTKPVEVTVPLRLVGTAPGIKAGGVLQILERRISVVCSVDQIPDYIEASVAKLKAGQTLYLKHAIMPEGVATVDDLKRPIATITVPRGYEELTSSDEEEEGEGGESGAAEAKSE